MFSWFYGLIIDNPFQQLLVFLNVNLNFITIAKKIFWGVNPKPFHVFTPLIVLLCIFLNKRKYRGELMTLLLAHRVY